LNWVSGINNVGWIIKDYLICTTGIETEKPVKLLVDIPCGSAQKRQ